MTGGGGLIILVLASRHQSGLDGDTLRRDNSFVPLPPAPLYSPPHAAPAPSPPSPSAANFKRKLELKGLAAHGLQLLQAFPSPPTDIQAEQSKAFQRTAHQWLAGMNTNSGGRALERWIKVDQEVRRPIAASIEAFFWATETAEFLHNTDTRNAMLRYLQNLFNDTSYRLDPIDDWSGDTESYLDASFGNKRKSPPSLSQWLDILNSIQQAAILPESPVPQALWDSALALGFTSEMEDYLRDEVRAQIAQHFYAPPKAP